MNDTLKVAGRIGAELGAAKAENERLRGLLRELREITSEYAWDADLEARVDATLSQQAEPTDAFTAVDMATAAAQGFRDGQAAVGQAPAPDEREAPVVVATAILGGIYHGGSGPELGEIDIEVCMPALEALQCETVNSSDDVFLPLMSVAQHERIVAALTRPAQTEQQPDPVLCDFYEADDYPSLTSKLVGHVKQLQEAAQRNVKPWEDTFPPTLLPAYIRRIEAAAPIAQTAPQGKFRMGDLVKKSTGSEWQGRICGTYSTALTPEGYAVESEAHAGSVQIYPAKALEAVE